MRFFWLSLISLVGISLLAPQAWSQPGSVVETGDAVLDPNQDGFISATDAGFNADGYDVDEFEIKMFGVPIFGDGEALADNANGPACGVSDLAFDSAGYAVYAGYDSNKNLIFRMRIGDNKPSVQSYTMFIDTDQAIGPEDPNSSSENPGFEIEITLIHRFGVFIYDVDGVESCPNPLRQYDVDTHQQKSVSSLESCGDEDYFLDFYVPFTDLEDLFGIDENTELRFAGVTNISATCALDGSISDIGGVDDLQYDGCFSCAMLDLTENQCPSGVSNLCDTCAGFPLGVTETPDIDTPVLVGDLNISGTAEPNAFIYIDLFDASDILFDQDSIESDEEGIWISNDLSRAMDFGDSIVVNALLPGRCQSGLNDAGLSFAIVSPNQPPQLFGNQATITYTEDDPPVLITSDIDITDDNDNLLGASIKISSNYVQGSDFLGGAPPGNISMTFDEALGILSLDGDALISDYIEALRSVNFYNTNDNPSLDIRTLTLKVTDGINFSADFNKDLIITPVNDPPTIIDSNDSIFVNTEEEVPIEICIEATDVDSDQFELESFVLKNASGSIELTSNLCLLYTPEVNFNGMEFVSVILCDLETNSLCDQSIIAIEVTPVNDPPVIVNPGVDPPVLLDSIGFKIEKNTTLEFCLEGFDIDGDNINVTDIDFSEPSNSSLIELGDLCFEYTPDEDFVGFETVTITFCDDGDPPACNTIIITFEVIDVNTAPVIETDTVFAETFKNIPVTVCIPALDQDGDLLTITEIEDAPENTVTVGTDPLCLDYSPPLNFTGEEHMKVTVCDDVNPALCDITIVEVTVIPTNNPPVVLEEEIPTDTVYFETTINTPLDFCLDVLDPDDDNVSINTLTVDGSSGSSILQTDDLCARFDPGVDFIGTEWVTVEICDTGDPQQCTTAVVEIEVFPVNRPPVIVENDIEIDTLYFVIDEDESFIFCLEVSDFENDPVSVEQITTVEQGGFYQPTEDELCLEFISLPGFVGNDIHVITVCDTGEPQGCDVVVVVIDILEVNHPPVFVFEGQPVDTLHYTVSANTPLDFCLEAIDEDSDPVAIDMATVSPEFGQIESGEIDDLCLTYIPPINFLGVDYLNPSVCDDRTPAACDAVVIEIEVVPDNNPPEVLLNGVAVDTLLFSTLVNQPVEICLEAQDPENDNVLIDFDLVDAELGEIIETGNDLCLAYQPAPDFLGNEWFTTIVCDDRFPFQCNDVVIGVNVVSDNTAPRIEYNDTAIDSLDVNTFELELLILSFGIIDDQNDALEITKEDLVSGSGQLSTQLNEDLIIQYTPDAGSSGIHRINLEVCDNGIPVLCDSISIGINVSAINLAPVAVNDTFALVQSPLVENILANDSDPDGDSLYVDVSQLDLPDIGLLEISGTGELQLEPYPDFEGVVEFDYVVCDVRSDQLCSTGSVYIDIPPKERVIIPFEAVSPNGDGLNDFWTIQDIIYFPDNKVRIFDRWNNMVFEASGYNNSSTSWTGQANHGVSRKDLPDGTYYFVIDPGDGTSTLSGMVVLKR